MFPLQDGEKINVVLPVKAYTEDRFVFMATSLGTVKKTPLTAFSRPLKKGIIAVNLDDGDVLIGAAITDGAHDVMLFSDSGKAVRFDENDVRPMGREARGVRGMQLGTGRRSSRCWLPRTSSSRCSRRPKTATANARRSPNIRATAVALRV